MSKISIGVVGCGHVAQHFYLCEFHRLKDKAELHAVYDLNEERAKQTAEKFGARACFTGLADMMALGWPVCFDVTHSTQQPGEAEGGKATGGRPQAAPTLARCAVAAGVQALFFETHPQPSKALCDASVMLPLKSMPDLLAELARLHAAVPPPPSLD